MHNISCLRIYPRPTPTTPRTQPPAGLAIWLVYCWMNLALHSLKSQPLMLSALHHFKSGQVPILLAINVESHGLDIPIVDLVINYDIPRYPRDYVHRVEHTTRDGRGGQSMNIVTQYQVKLVHDIRSKFLIGFLNKIC